MCTKSDIPQGEHYYIGVKLIKARPAYGLLMVLKGSL